MAGLDANTLLLLHMDGLDESTTFTDSSTAGVNSPHTMTAGGNAQIDTAQSVFGGASGLFDGVGDYLSTPDSADWVFGDFTIDCRIRFAALPTTGNGMGIFSQRADGTHFQRFMLNNVSNVLYWFWWSIGGSAEISIAKVATLSADTWYHVAIVRSGSNWYFFQDGTQVGTTGSSAATTPDVAAVALVGAVTTSSSSLNGWFDELRISNIARWTANFTPPTEAYSADVTWIPKVLVI